MAGNVHRRDFLKLSLATAAAPLAAEALAAEPADCASGSSGRAEARARGGQSDGLPGRPAHLAPLEQRDADQLSGTPHAEVSVHVSGGRAR